MRRSMTMILALVLMGTVGSFAAEKIQKSGETGSAATTATMQVAEEKAIRETADAYTAAFNKGDAKAVAALWTQECEYTDEIGRVTNGRGAIEKEYAEFFKTRPGVQMEASVSSIRILGPAVALEDGSTLLKSARGKLISRGYYNAVHVKEGGKWLLASVREHGSPSSPSVSKVTDLDWLIGEWTTDREAGKADLKFRWIMDKQFIELSYTVKDDKGNARSGIQIIGREPASGALGSWSFFANGGTGNGRWTPFKKGWIIDSVGHMPDGTSTVSTYIISRSDENSLDWQSMNRRIGGKRLKDAGSVILKRKIK